MVHGGRGPVDRRTLLRTVGAGSLAALAGCVAGDDDSADETNDEGDDESDIEPEPVDVSESATWRTATLEDVTTGEEFAIESFDRPAIVHTFAIGCAVCHSQHKEFADLYASETDVELVDLTIESNQHPEAVRAHTEKEGFDWRFSVAPESVTGSLVDDFGQEVLVSADSPLVLVYPDGDTYRLEKVIDDGPLASIIEEHR